MSERSEHEVMINGIPSTVMLTDDEAANWFPIPTKPAAAPESADPEIATLAPDTGVVDAEAVVSVTGSSFVDGSAVEVDGTAVATVFVSDAELTATFTPTAVGTAQFSVRNPDDMESNNVPFEVTAAEVQRQK